MRIRTFTWAALLAVGTLFTAACGDDDDDNSGTAGSAGSAAGTDGGAGDGGTGGAAGGTAGTSGDAGTAGTTAAGTGGGAGTGAAGTGPVAFACEGAQTIKPGLNEKWTAGGKERSFYATFPKDTTKPMAVVFWWHGYGGNAKDWEAVAPSPDTDPEFPFIVITPEDTDLFPPKGLDWSIFEAKTGQANIEASLFEAVNGCLAAQYPINDKQLYVAGFSAGAIMTNMLATRYQGRIAASLAFSGAWFNDPEETKTINTLGIPVNYSWDDLAAPSTGMVLITHGGPTDTFSFQGNKVIDFEVCAQAAQPFLTGAKRSYIDCAHNGGHTPDPSVTAELAIQYFKDHRVGEPSPYLGGKLPAAFPASCKLHE